MDKVDPDVKLKMTKGYHPLALLFHPFKFDVNYRINITYIDNVYTVRSEYMTSNFIYVSCI